VLEGFRSTDSRADDGSIETEERILAVAPVVPFSESGARELGRAYWASIPQVSRGLVRACVRDGGVVIRLVAVAVPLLRFGPAEVLVEDERLTCRYPILGGLLALRPGGALVIAQTGKEPAEIHVAVTGFAARLGGGRVYRHLQQRIHVAVSRRVFARLLEGQP
jgi:hypothetical protein